jgi:hypothetical protein
VQVAVDKALAPPSEMKGRRKSKVGARS